MDYVKKNLSKDKNILQITLVVIYEFQKDKKEIGAEMMSLISKLIGRDFSYYYNKAKEHMKAEEWGEAKLLLEKALKFKKELKEDVIKEILEKLVYVKDKLAEKHIEQGDKFRMEGEWELAIQSYETALEVVGSEGMRRQIEERIEAIEAEKVRQEIEEEEKKELSEEELFAILTGNWIEEQQKEMESYGEEVKKAIILLHEGDRENSLKIWEELLKKHSDGCYIYLEYGKALFSIGKLKEAITYIELFLQKLKELPPEKIEKERGKGERWEAELMARNLLVNIYSELKDDTKLEEELNKIIELIPERSDGYVALARFLRTRKRYEDAIDVLEAGEKYIGEIYPDLRLPMELGLCLIETGKKEKAIKVLESIIEHLVSRGVFDFDPEFALPLAQLYEEYGYWDKASDLYRHLAEGSDFKNRLRYNLKAGEILLRKLNKPDIAKIYLVRAKELAKENPEFEESLNSLLKEIEAKVK